MTCKILTEDRWARFLEGTLNDQEKALIKAHMDTDCPDCEYLLRGINPAQAKYLRFLFNDKIAGRSAQSGAALDLDEMPSASALLDHENEIAALEASAMPWNKTSNKVEAHISKYRTPIWMGGIAALLLITVGILPRILLTDGSNKPDQSQILKGDVKALMPIRLQFVTGRLDENNHYTFTRGVIGRQYSESDSLFLHYDVPDDGYVYLLGYQAGKGVDLISPAQAALQPAGPYNLPPDIHDKGISLKGVRGHYAVIGLYSPAPLQNLDETLAAIRRAVDPGTGVVDKAILNSIGQPVTVDVIHFDVSG